MYLGAHGGSQGSKVLGTISLSSLQLPPDQSKACTEYAAGQTANQKPEPLCFLQDEFTTASAPRRRRRDHVYIWDWLRRVEAGLMAGDYLDEATHSVQAFDWSGGSCRGKERDSTQHFLSLVARPKFPLEILKIYGFSSLV